MFFRGRNVRWLFNTLAVPADTTILQRGTSALLHPPRICHPPSTSSLMTCLLLLLFLQPPLSRHLSGGSRPPRTLPRRIRLFWSSTLRPLQDCQSRSPGIDEEITWHQSVSNYSLFMMVTYMTHCPQLVVKDRQLFGFIRSPVVTRRRLSERSRAQCS